MKRQMSKEMDPGVEDPKKMKRMGKRMMKRRGRKKSRY
jgi:hypothetical protein